MTYRGAWLALLAVVTAQTTSGIVASPTVSTSAASNGSTSPSSTAPVLQLSLNLGDVWDLLIGPVETAETTTTYSPTPVPSSSLIPPPPLYYSPFPTGQEVPFVAKNESWAFPDHFWYVNATFLTLQSLTILLGGESPVLLSRSKVQQRTKVVVPVFGMLCPVSRTTSSTTPLPM
jgi:hypothetical protein